jgi:hypothetical protein
MIGRTEFFAVVTAAVDDLLENGFDSQERLDMWLERIQAAARRALISERDLTRTLQNTLGQIYERTTRTAKLIKAHPGVSQFTIELIRPKLRAELDRRILASANLIKLNRDASIARTLKRFAGWATSIPIGGTEVGQRKETKELIRKGISALPFEERRVIIDQGHKLTAAVNDIVAQDGGAIALIWHHVMERGDGYDPRPEHVARNGKIYVLRDNWAIKEGLMKLAGAIYYDTITAVSEEVYCRCTAEYLYALRDLPAEMLTAKGRLALASARKKMGMM